MVDVRTRRPAPVGGGAPPAAMRRRGPLTPLFFLIPYLLLFGMFVAVPAVYGLYISLHEWDYLLPGKPFVGLDNYAALFDPASPVHDNFWTSMKATGIFTVGSVPPLVVLPLGVAIILNRRFPGRTFFRAVFFLPFVLGVAVISVMWRILLDPNLGFVNHLFGLDIPWTTDLPWAWVSLIGITVWWTLGFNAVIYLAGLQDIPRELYDAASVDGAGAWHRFVHVTLPGLRPVAVFVTTTTILASANMFGQALLVTQGAPGVETRTAIMYIAQEGLVDYRMGSAAAMSYVLTFILIVVSVINFRIFRSRS
ncbi:carbohydrate ABC transporter permease [Nonomuraea sp. NPDC048826]|uniref:carbohydrate ABC transporter permease n=1 Tax=Nonomuraea sp. NPDC048826 TaxID=3364347 RepID=UPI00371B561B